MEAGTMRHSDRYSARLLLLVVVMVPLVPELVILTTGSVASLTGCRQDQIDACAGGSVAALINGALWASGVGVVTSAVWRLYFNLATCAWLIVCYALLMFGWARMRSRLLLGMAVALYLASLPFVAPLLAIKTFADSHLCKPESTGCKLFGSQINNAYAALEMASLPFNDWGPYFVAGIFVCFVFFLLAGRTVSGTRAVEP